MAINNSVRPSRKSLSEMSDSELIKEHDKLAEDIEASLKSSDGEHKLWSLLELERELTTREQ